MHNNDETFQSKVQEENDDNKTWKTDASETFAEYDNKKFSAKTSDFKGSGSYFGKKTS